VCRGDRAAGEVRQPRPALIRDFSEEWRDRQGVVQFVKAASTEPGGGETVTAVQRRTDKGGLP